jgi:hypothetical protein
MTTVDKLKKKRKDNNEATRKMVDTLLTPRKPSPHAPPERLSRVRNTYDGPFYWTPQKVLAARMLATGEFSVPEVAKAVGVHKQSVYYWRTFSRFHAMIEKLVFETGLANEPERLHYIKKRVHQIDRILSDKLDSLANPQSIFDLKALSELNVSPFFRHEANLLEALERKDKGADTTIRHTFEGFNGDQKKVLALKEIIAELPDEAAKPFKDYLHKKAEEIILRRREEKKQKAEEKNNEVQ